jgi:hypothetical protein
LTLGVIHPMEHYTTIQSSCREWTYLSNGQSMKSIS